MILLHIASMSWLKTTGFSTSIPALISSQNRVHSVEACLSSTLPDSGHAPEVDFPIFARKQLFGGRGPFGLPTPFHKPDLVIFHGLYPPRFLSAANRARKAGIPYIICPRGSMARNAQAHKRWMKRIGHLLSFNRLVANATAVHCLTRREAEHVASTWNRPVLVVGNGIHLPPRSYLAMPGSSAGLRLVFVGRLAVQHKGLDLLLEACAMARSSLLEHRAQVELYGPDFRGGARVLGSRIAQLGLNDVVTLNERVVDEAKRLLLREADVFLHTSRWEGHSMAVLEALAHGVPCLLTPQTNMADEVATAGAGWSVEGSPAGIAGGLLEVLNADRKKLQEMGIRARELAAQKHDWESIAFRTVEQYRQYTSRSTTQLAGQHKRTRTKALEMNTCIQH